MVLRASFAAALVLSLAACGGDGDERREISRGEYRSMLEEFVQDVGRSVDDVEDFDTTGKQTQNEGRLLVAALERQTDILAGVDPPNAIQRAHEDFLEAAREIRAHVDAELELLAEEPGASGDEVEDRLLRAPAVEPVFQKLESAAREIDRAGYGPVQGG
jgi:hypothetical protein